MTDETNSNESKRQAQRDSLFLSATVELPESGASIVTRVRNLAPGGMLIDGNSAFTLGTRLSTTLRGIGHVTGHIAWATPGRAGVAFDIEIDPKDARNQVSMRGPEPTYGRRQDYSRRPGLKPRG